MLVRTITDGEKKVFCLIHRGRKKHMQGNGRFKIRRAVAIMVALGTIGAGGLATVPAVQAAPQAIKKSGGTRTDYKNTPTVGCTEAKWVSSFYFGDFFTAGATCKGHPEGNPKRYLIRIEACRDGYLVSKFWNPSHGAWDVAVYYIFDNDTSTCRKPPRGGSIRVKTRIR